MLLPPSELRLAEAYIYDDFDIEGESEAILPLMERFFERRWSKLEQLRHAARLLSLPNTGRSRPTNQAAKLRGPIHSKARDREAVLYHYGRDRANDFFALWLDSRMTYSCAYFAKPDDDLETAQKYKLDYICRKLRLQPRERLLDIGFGWGSLLIYAAQQYGVEADGITLVPEQAAWARERIEKAGLEHRCRIDVCDYREVNKPQRYHKLAAVESAEHVGERRLTMFFKCAWDLLEPGGVFLNQMIARNSAIPPLGVDFILRYAFPDVEAPAISVTLRAAEAGGFEVRDVENLRDHYVYTLRHWLRRLEQHAEAARRIGGDITYRTWRLYVLMAFREMAVGTANVYQTLLLKREKGRNSLPLRREDWYGAVTTRSSIDLDGSM